MVYAETVLGVNLWDKQREILMAMMSDRLVSVKAVTLVVKPLCRCFCFMVVNALYVMSLK